MPKSAAALLNFIDASPSPWHAAHSIASQLRGHGFEQLSESADWSLNTNGRYYAVRDDSSIIAFIVGRQTPAEHGFKIVGAHTDSPGLRVKPQPWLSGDGYARVALDVYGGPILASFTDRDLGLAGRLVYQQTDGSLVNSLIDFKRAMLRLPNLAIHLNRAVNEDGLKLNKQTELAGILGLNANQQLNADHFTHLLAEHVQASVEQILSWELAVYDVQPGNLWGAEQEFIADGQLDNLASCHAGLTALLAEAGAKADATRVCAFFDHEEVGSNSAKGASGSFLGDVLQRITLSSGGQGVDWQRALAHSFIISADMAHAYHPNYPGAYEPNHKVFVNQGPVIKINANQHYATDCQTEAQFIAYCREAEVPFQKYAHRGDLACGSTIGPLCATRLGIRTVDVGAPMWAMHSLRESAGALDHKYMIQVLRRFFSA